MSLNKAILTGKIIEEPEIRYTNSDDAVTRLLIETGDAVRLRLACWRNLADKAKDLKAGDFILASGSLIINSYKTNSGINRKDFEFNAKDLYLLGGEPQNINPIPTTSSKNNASANSKPAAPKKAASSEEDLSDVLLGEDEIPF
jgi:single-strand DNA-binding protein